VKILLLLFVGRLGCRPFFDNFLIDRKPPRRYNIIMEVGDLVNIYADNAHLGVGIVLREERKPNRELIYRVYSKLKVSYWFPHELEVISENLAH